MIYELVTDSMTKESIPPTPTNVISPWDAILREYGWKPDRVNELDDDDLTVSFVCDSVYLSLNHSQTTKLESQPGLTINDHY